MTSELNITIVVLTQIQRDANNKKLELNDFAPLDQYADLVLGLHKENKEVEILSLKK